MIALIPSLIVSTVILSSYEKRALSIRGSEVLSQSKIVANQIAESTLLNKDIVESEEQLKAQMDMITTIYNGRVMIIDGNFKVSYDSYGMDKNRTLISEEVIRSYSGKAV
ncbi:MAG: two-component sensor histidine kinase, partial [Agathobacter sp.]|nr:two-component sensor histidine kinase [Agathobacter sp.]